MRIFLFFYTGFAVFMLVGLGLAALSRAHDPRATATVATQLPHTKACPGYAMVSYSTPDGRPHQVRLCAQGSVPPVGSSIQIRYASSSPDQEVAPAAEDRITGIVPIPAVLLVVGLVGLLAVWRWPDAVLRSGLRVRRPWGGQPPR